MSLMGDIEEFIKNNPGCSFIEITSAFSDFPKKIVMITASELRRKERVFFRLNRGVIRHYPRNKEYTPKKKNRKVSEKQSRNPDVVKLSIKAEELEDKGFFRRAATVWLQAYDKGETREEKDYFMARRARCVRKSTRGCTNTSGGDWPLSGHYAGGELKD
ncbi:PerC family transcriptional regulator [Escherichia coli]|nr:PerC family transcriptional regulator [Escherichia coli]EHR9097597.1 PerC family transcriptional regulator [Escherichia coli]EIM2919101.1 PerC family transcriptional regulator [Escherichia coli]EIM2935062.1 PerC family transcriptional regulator [Escherichia coli]EIM2940869.1 PerC family transcriptional regulator [Escherichia coli]